MKYIIDRFEGDFAVIELADGSRADMPRKLVPAAAKEGDTLRIEVDEEETKRREERIGRLMDSLFE